MLTSPGSMHGVEKDTIGGCNAFGADIDTQAAGAQIGIAQQETCDFDASPGGVLKMRCAMESEVSKLRKS